MPIRPFRHRVRVRPRLGFARWDRPALIAAVAIGLAAIGFGVLVIGVTWRSARQPDADADVAAMTQPTADDASTNARQSVDAMRQPPETSAAAGGTPGVATAPALRTGSGRSTFAAEKYPDQGVAQLGALGRSWRDPAPLVTQLAVGPHPPPSVAARLPRVVATVPASALGFAWPLRGYVTSSFDDEHPLGIDIAPSDSLGLILAARDGRVLIAGGDPCCSYGYFVLLDHGDGLTSIYGHFRDAPAFRPGEWVERGTVLGVAGDTGHSFGVHLHFEVRLNGVPVDPQLVLTAGFLSPLVPRAPVQSGDPTAEATPSPSPAEPESEGPEGREPSASDDAPGDGDITPDASPTPTPTPSMPPPGLGSRAASPSPAPTAASSPTPRPTATPVPSAVPTPTAATAPPADRSPSPTPFAAATATPSSTTSPALSGGTASPGATPTASPSSSPSPTPSASPTPTPSPTPAPCVTVRYQPGGAPPVVTNALAPFIGLDVESGRVGSFMAEQCGTSGVVRITAMPVAGERCSAGLYAGSDTLLRPLMASATSDDQGMRWSLEANDLAPGVRVRIVCAPESDRGGG